MQLSWDEEGRKVENREIKRLQEQNSGLRKTNLSLQDQIATLTRRLEEARRGSTQQFEGAKVFFASLQSQAKDIEDLRAERSRLLSEIGGYMRANGELERRVLARGEAIRRLESHAGCRVAMIDAQEVTIALLTEALEGFTSPDGVRDDGAIAGHLAGLGSAISGMEHALRSVIDEGRAS